MNFVKLFVCWALLSLSTSVWSGNTYTTDYLQILNLTPFSLDEPQNPNWAGYTQIRFNNAIAWSGTSGCASDAVAIRNEDSHILSMVMQAFALDKPLRLFSWSTNRISGSSRCILRAVSVQK